MKKTINIILLLTCLYAVDYQTEIQPIFNADCTNCHGYPNQYGNLVLFSYDDLINSGAVVPGDASSSSLYDRITRDESENGDMPPTGSLTSVEIGLIADWINDGALFEELNDITGCMDSNAIDCGDDIDSTYFPECATCSDGIVCDNYYNSEATIDNGLCMYSDIPSYDEFIITETSSGFDLDWNSFTPPVDILQYVLQRCLDPDGDSDGDGVLEYENCTMLIAPGTFYLETSYSDDIGEDDGYSKYTLYVHYPNNNYWGSAQGYYYYEDVSDCIAGDVSNDGVINVIDIVSLVNHILGSSVLDDTCAADLNSDGIINVIDIVSLVNLILS